MRASALTLGQSNEGLGLRVSSISAHVAQSCNAKSKSRVCFGLGVAALVLSATNAVQELNRL